METDRPNPCITNTDALNALADAVRWYRFAKTVAAKKAMFQALDRAERPKGVNEWNPSNNPNSTHVI